MISRNRSSDQFIVQTNEQTDCSWFVIAKLILPSGIVFLHEQLVTAGHYSFHSNIDSNTIIALRSLRKSCKKKSRYYHCWRSNGNTRIQRIRSRQLRLHSSFINWTVPQLSTDIRCSITFLAEFKYPVNVIWEMNSWIPMDNRLLRLYKNRDICVYHSKVDKSSQAFVVPIGCHICSLEHTHKEALQSSIYMRHSGKS